MRLSFINKKCREICEQEAVGVRALGAPAAKKLRTLLANIEAATTVATLPSLGNPHPLKGDRLGQFSIGIDQARRVVIISVNDPVPLTVDGAVDWSKVTAIQIIFIGDYHD